MSYDFSKLPTELQDWFLSWGTKPESSISANSIVLGYLKSDVSFLNIFVKLNTPLKCKDGTQLNEIVIKEKNYYTAYLSEVWKELNVEQKLSIIYKTYYLLVNDDQILKHNPPKLALFDNRDYSKGTYDELTNTITLKIDKILLMKNAFDIPSYIVHELTHAKQKLERDSLIESQKYLKEMSAREVAIIFESTSAYASAFEFFNQSDRQTLKEVVAGSFGITEQDIDLIKNNQESNDLSWDIILKLPYICHPMEIEAYRTQNYFRNKMIDVLSEKYEILEQKHDDEFKRVINLLNDKTKFGFNLNDKSFENLAKLNYALGATVGEERLYTAEASKIICSGMKSLVELYKNKQIDSELDYLDYNKLLDLKQQQLGNEEFKIK